MKQIARKHVRNYLFTAPVSLTISSRQTYQTEDSEVHPITFYSRKG
jgi:hypothetical protein